MDLPKTEASRAPAQAYLKDQSVWVGVDDHCRSFPTELFHTVLFAKEFNKAPLCPDHKR